MRISAFLSAFLSIGLVFAGSVQPALAVVVDTQFGFASVSPSNPTDEADALANALHFGDASRITYLGKYEDGSLSSNLQSDGSNWYLDVGSLNPDYFVVKVGNGSPSASGASHYFFKNIPALNILAFNLNQLSVSGFCSNCGIDDVSHVTMFSVSPVPLPATLPLLAGGIGILGWLGHRGNRRRTKAA